MDKYGKLIADDTLMFERMLPGPIERVWDYLTDPNKRRLWFAGGPMDLQPQGDITFVFNHDRLSPNPDSPPEKYKEHANGSTSKAMVLECTPPSKLVIEWEGKVTFQLSTEGQKVKLTLTHERLADKKEIRIGVMAGWHTHLDILVDRMNEKDPPGFWGVHMRLEEEYEDRFY